MWRPYEHHPSTLLPPRLLPFLASPNLSASMTSGSSASTTSISYALFEGPLPPLTSSNPATPNPTTPNPATLVTSLKDLTRYSPGQEAAIQAVFDQGIARGGKGAFKHDHSAWVEFRDSVWGEMPDSFDRVDISFERGVHPIDDFLIKSLDPFLPASDSKTPPPSPTYGMVEKCRRVMTMPEELSAAWGSCVDQILIRAEYDEAEAAVLSARGKGARGFLVTGQPGIGFFPFCAFSNLF